MGHACFSIPYAGCDEGSASISTASPSTAAAAFDATTSSASPVPDAPTTSPNPTSPTTIAPSKSPVYNIFFCGETYEVAEANCWTAEACPSGTCSNAGEQCFGISVESCLSSAPTDAPTVAGPRPSASPTVSPSPTASPSTSHVPTVEVVNTLFCGVDYDNAMSSCSEATGCPSGAGCPNGMNCFSGILCAALLPPSSAPPTTFWNTLIGAPGVTQPPVPLIQKYCGADVKDATSLCAVKIPCHDGNTLVCPFGETCFEIAGQCGEVDDVSAPTVAGSRQPMNPAAGSTQPSALIPAASTPSVSPMGGVFDLNRDRCGDNYEDAFMNCRDRLACTLGATGECPTGQTCYPVVICETPPPSPTAGVNQTDTSKPPVGGAVTEKPAWEWDLNAVTKTSGSYTIKVFLTKCIVLAGATLLVV